MLTKLIPVQGLFETHPIVSNLEIHQVLSRYCRWSVATHKKDLSPDELRKAGEAFFEEISKTKTA